MIKTIFLVRHGETNFNSINIILGQCNEPLNITGQLQAKNLYKQIKDIDFEIAICSALQRTEQTLKCFIQD